MARFLSKTQQDTKSHPKHDWCLIVVFEKSSIFFFLTRWTSIGSEGKDSKSFGFFGKGENPPLRDKGGRVRRGSPGLVGQLEEFASKRL